MELMLAVAVAVVKEDVMVGHIPFNLAPFISAFLSRDTNSGFAKVVGEMVNRGAGYGLEIPCSGVARILRKGVLRRSASARHV